MNDHTPPLTSLIDARLAFAEAEELQKNVDSLRSRVAELEAALRKLQAEISNEPHPLLVGTPESSVPPNIPVAARATVSSRSDPTLASQVPHDEEDFIDAFGECCHFSCRRF